jgi:hypothetical protein
VPVDVVDRQGRHLDTARPQPRQHRQDRDVAASGAGPPIATLQHPRDLIHGDRAHHTAVTPTRSEFAVGGVLQDVGDTFVDTPTLLADSDVVTTPKLTT